MEYVKCGDIKQAAKTSGYALATAKALFAKPKIQDWIRQTSRLGLPTDMNASKEWYIYKLVKVINHGIPDDDEPLNLMMARLALLAGEQLCKLRGFYEADKKLNIVARTDLEQLHALMDKIKEREKDY
jgi:hypothetical protein